MNPDLNKDENGNVIGESATIPSLTGNENKEEGKVIKVDFTNFMAVAFKLLQDSRDAAIRAEKKVDALIALVKVRLGK